MTFEQTTGTRAQVWHGTAKKTSGGLTKSALMMNKHGRIVSRKKHNTAKKEKRLVKAGFLTKKGQFGFIKKGSKSKKMRGGDENEGDMNTMSSDMNTMSGDKRDSAMGMSGGKMRGGTGSAVGTGNLGSPLDRALLAGGGRRRRTRRMRGGMAFSGALSPSTYDGKGVGTTGVGVQFVAGNAA